MEDYVFDIFAIDKEKIKIISRDLYEVGITRHIYEACIFPLYWSLKYNFSLDANYIDDSINSSDCVFMLLAYLKANRNKDKEAKKKIKDIAKSLVSDIDRYWIFIYEVLSKEELPIGEYRTLKKRNISFVKREYL